MDTKKSIDALQVFVTGLSGAAFVHKIQGQIFKSQGFTKLGEKYINHYNEEMGWVEKFVDRIFDLGGDVKIEKYSENNLIKEPLKYLQADLATQETGVEMLRKCIETIHQDATTYDILKEYLKDEEQDLYWTQTQLGLIEQVGVQNWLIIQL